MADCSDDDDTMSDAFSDLLSQNKDVAQYEEKEDKFVPGEGKSGDLWPV